MLVIYGAGSSVAEKIVEQFENIGRETLCLSRTKPDFIPVDRYFHYDDQDKFIERLCEWRRANHSTPITVLLLTAFSSDKLFGLMDADEIQLSLSINVTNQLLFCHKVLKRAKTLGPMNLSYISSFRSKYPTRGISVYAASKSFNETFFRNIALEYGKFGIRSNSIRLGFLDTGLSTKGIFHGRQKDIEDAISVERMCTAKDLADCLKSLELCEYLNGSVIDLNGGLNITV